MTSYLLIVNPVSGGGAANRKARLLRERLAATADVHIAETTRRGAAADCAASAASEVDRVIAVGGDGTLNEVLTGLIRCGGGADDLPSLGFLPSGTANAATSAFGFSPFPDEMVRALARVMERPVDIGMVSFEDGDRPFLLWCGAGFDAVLIDQLNRARSGRMGISGLLRNTPRVVRALARYSAPPIQAEINRTRVREAASVIVTNVREMAFGGTVANTADPFDGHLDVVAVNSASKLRMVGLGLRMLTSELTGGHGVWHEPAAHVRLSATGAVPVQLDGEPVGRLPITVRVKPGAIRLMMTGSPTAAL